ncbi:MEKHLA domain-containing protein [Capilliphycus salinus ALCB114379]|uniref:MEKHLA domain-containing protein n=1 Tax=Capilliphycus salinus TaxID=2768948 RepID=UPI0039A49986
MTSFNSYPWKQDPVILQSLRLFKSFKHWTGESLVDLNGTPEEIAEALFNAPFVLVSHGTEANPIFNYGNRTALELWEISWEEFIQTPSSQTAINLQEIGERQQMLDQVRTQGYTKNYRGIRQSRTGKQFLISNVTVWNIIDESAEYCGQGATYKTWEFL